MREATIYKSPKGGESGPVFPGEAARIKRLEASGWKPVRTIDLDAEAKKPARPLPVETRLEQLEALVAELRGKLEAVQVILPEGDGELEVGVSDLQPPVDLLASINGLEERLVKLEGEKLLASLAELAARVKLLEDARAKSKPGPKTKPDPKPPEA
jgi:hypothetical protein